MAGPSRRLVVPSAPQKKDKEPVVNKNLRNNKEEDLPRNDKDRGENDDQRKRRGSTVRSNTRPLKKKSLMALVFVCSLISCRERSSRLLLLDYTRSRPSSGQSIGKWSAMRCFHHISRMGNRLRPRRDSEFLESSRPKVNYLSSSTFHEVQNPLIQT